jgi:hypothetical protein
MYAVAASWMSGWRAVEPEVVMLPVTQLTVGAAVGVAAGVLVAIAAVVGVAAAAGVSVGVTVGVGVAEAEHAPTIIAAAIAMAPKRRIPLINLVSPLCWTDG